MNKLSRRRAIKSVGIGGMALMTSTLVKAEQTVNNCSRYQTQIDYRGEHQQGVLTPEQKETIVLSCAIQANDIAEVEALFRVISSRIAFLTRYQTINEKNSVHAPPAESGILGATIAPDSLTITMALGASFFSQFSLDAIKPRHLVTMKQFPNDKLQAAWCFGDVLLQFCANSHESAIYALRDILKHSRGRLYPQWKIDGFLPARNIDCKETAINLFGFKDGTGNAGANDRALMDEIVWVTEKNNEPDWAIGGTYQAVRLIRFNVEFWDRTPLEDQENDFGRYKTSGAPLGTKKEFDDPNMEKDPHGDRILFSSHMRRAEPRIPERHVAKLRRRSYNYSLGVLPNGALDMGMIFICHQNDLKRGFIDTQNRLNGEPLERYITPFGGGYFFVLPGIKQADDFLGRRLFAAVK